MANLNIRIDENLKHDVENILYRLGLNASDAVRIFFTRIREERGIPFELKLSAQSYEKWANQAISDAESDIKAGKISRSFKTVDELISSLNED